MDNQNFGREIFTKTFDPDLIAGWGKRTYNWEMGVSVQHELLPRLGVTVGYFRRSFGNFYTANNRNTTTADYTPFSIPIPADPRLPGGGGGTVSGLYNLVPAKVGQEDLYSQLTENFGKMTENWHGIDVNVNARLRNGLDGAGRHQHRPPAAGQLRRARGAAGDLQLDEHHRGPDHAGHHLHRRPGQSVVPRRGAVPDLVPRPRHLHRAQGRRERQHDLAQRPRPRAGGQLRRDQRHGAAVARPASLLGQRHREPGRAGARSTARG